MTDKEDKIKITLENGDKVNFIGDFKKLWDDLTRTKPDGWICISNKIIVSKKKILYIEKGDPK